MSLLNLHVPYMYYTFIFLNFENNDMIFDLTSVFTKKNHTL